MVPAAAIVAAAFPKRSEKIQRCVVSLIASAATTAAFNLRIRVVERVRHVAVGVAEGCLGLITRAVGGLHESFDLRRLVGRDVGGGSLG